MPFCFVSSSEGESEPIEVTEEGKIAGIRGRKLTKQNIHRYVDCAGLYMIHSSAVDLVPRDEFIGIFGEEDIVERVIEDGKDCIAVTPTNSLEVVSVGTAEEYENILENGIK